MLWWVASKSKNRSLCLQNRVTHNNLKRYNRREDAVCAPWERCVRAACAPCARRERAVNTLQQLLARCKNVMDAVKTLWERREDAIGTLWGRCVHAITGKFDILGVFSGDPTASWHGFRTLYKRCGNAVWCDRGLRDNWWHQYFINQLNTGVVFMFKLNIFTSHKMSVTFLVSLFWI